MSNKISDLGGVTQIYKHTVQISKQVTSGNHITRFQGFPPKSYIYKEKQISNQKTFSGQWLYSDRNAGVTMTNQKNYGFIFKEVKKKVALFHG